MDMARDILLMFPKFQGTVGASPELSYNCEEAPVLLF